MDKTEFGDSDLMVSKIGLGLAALGRPGYINLGHSQDMESQYQVDSMQARAHRLLDKAMELGINYFDVAQSYGRGEEFLSSWLSDKQVVVGSKWGYYYTADWKVEADKHEIKEHSLELLNKQWPESKSRLSPQLSIYHIHSATFESGILSNHQVLERLEELRAGGTIVGLSLSGVQQAEVLDEAMKIKIGDKALFGSVQATYNLLETSAERSLEKAHDNGLGVIIKEAVANGRLTGRKKQAEYYNTLLKLSQKYNVDVDAIAIAFVLQKPFVNVVLSGAATKDQLISNVHSINLELEKNDIQTLEQLRMSPKAYWDERSEMAWN